MSEPDSGSDLASLRTRAEKVDGRLYGQRHQGLDQQRPPVRLHDRTLRTHVEPANKHAGLSQFLVDTKTPGITISPIIDLTGKHHFNEVVFQDAFVPEDSWWARRATAGSR